MRSGSPRNRHLTLAGLDHSVGGCFVTACRGGVGITVGGSAAAGEQGDGQGSGGQGEKGAAHAHGRSSGWECGWITSVTLALPKCQEATL